MAAAGPAGRVVTALSRYLDDVLADDQDDIILGHGAGTLSSVAFHVRFALQMAAANLAAAADSICAEARHSGKLGPAAHR